MELSKSQKQGKIAEFLAFEKLIEHGWEIFTPIVDTGIDAIIRKVIKGKVQLLEVQVKSVISKKQAGFFRVDDLDDLVKGENFLIICADLSEEEHKFWILPAEIFKKYARVHVNKEKDYRSYLLDIFSTSQDDNIERSERLKEYLNCWDKLGGK